jgi:5-methylcytosine-specific restriction endonuclease McrA
MLVWRFLRAGVMEGTLFASTERGTPQGGIISPLLANVYLHELDMYMQRRTGFPSHVRRRRRLRGYANFVHVRYADDFVVMCNGTKADAEAMKQELQQFLTDELRLTLSDEKTMITHVNDGFRFLGFDIRREVTGNGVMWPKHTIPQDAIKKLRAKVQAITARSSCNNAVAAKLIAMNHYLRGWGNHYRTAYNAREVFAKLDHLVFWQLAHWLGAKFKCRMPVVMRRFRHKAEGASTLAMGAHSLWRLRCAEFEQLRKRTFCNPYVDPKPLLAREEQFGSRHTWIGNETRPGTEDLRPLVLTRDQWTCQVCGVRVTRDTNRIDHVRPIRRFKRRVDAQTLENLQTLCRTCHDQKTTNGD